LIPALLATVPASSASRPIAPAASVLARQQGASRGMSPASSASRVAGERLAGLAGLDLGAARHRRLAGLARLDPGAARA
jgi:hypothetical protein